ncbi:MAG: hypothetical protein V4660_03685 [Pseudomonadota bacterium]
MKLTKTRRLFASTALMLATSTLSEAATAAVASGITLYTSYDDLDLPRGISWDSNITQIHATTADSSSPIHSIR